MAIEYYISSNKYSLQERNTKRGKVYDVIFRVTTIDGEAKQKRLCGYTTKALAKQGYLEFITECCTLVKNNPLKKKNVEKDIPLVGDLFREYIASLGNQNKQSVIYLKVNNYNLFIKPFYDNTKIDKLTAEELYKWQDNLWKQRNEKTGEFFSYNYLSRIRTAFSSFLTWAKKRYGYENNFSNVEKPKRRQPKRRMQFWTKEQFSTFISVVDNPTYHALFTFMFYTGRRKGEIFALYKTDVQADKVTFDKSVNRRNYRGEKWQIDTTKEDKACTLPVCKPVQEEIKRYTPPKEGKFYFGGKEPLPPTSVDRAFKKYTEMAGLQPIRLHDLRHSFVSLCIHLGGNLMVVSELISDTVEQVMRTYAHLWEEDKLSILDKM